MASTAKGAKQPTAGPAATPKATPAATPQTAPSATPRVAGDIGPKDILIAALLAASTVVYAAMSQQMLAPVYGSLIANARHDILIVGGIFTGGLLQYFVPGIESISAIPPLIASYLPLALSYLFKYSDRLGAEYGPLVTEAAVLFPIIALATACAGSVLRTVPPFDSYPLLLFVAVPGLHYMFVGFETSLSEYYLNLAPQWKPAVQTAVSLATAGLAMSQTGGVLGLAALPAVYLTTSGRPLEKWNRDTAALSARLEPLGYKILERAQSNTGYISVVDDLNGGFRVLRCDHSVLGGEWLYEPGLYERQGMTGTEPIYAVFEMLEAVRLIQTPDSAIPDTDKTALVIGLGVGTAPKALQAHGVATTIVELDPVVYAYATKHFGLATNHTAHLTDAVPFVRAAAAAAPAQYDYIVHDVFTGGAEPLALFTQRFVTDLALLLKPDGAVAINYAGDRALRPTKQVVNTINVVFEGRCRIFRDMAPEEGNGDDDGFSNMVIFCLNPVGGAEGHKPVFRQPVEKDFLGAVSRAHYLLPREANELPFPTAEDMEEEEVTIITEQNMGTFRAQQLNGARRHWKIMRTVLESVVWNQW